MIKCSHIAIASFSLALSFSTSLNAAMHFLPEYEDKWGSFSSGVSIGGRVQDEKNRCFDAGYRITSCPEGFFFKESEYCPYSLDKKYYKACYSLDSKCIEEGYTTSCAKGYEADKSKVCSYNSSYTKCKPAECAGYEYTQAEANATGYVADGEPCLSGTEYKYKRKPNPCTGYNYDSSNCGVSSCGKLSGGTPCLSGTVQKYKTCEVCPVENLGAPILYSDKSYSNEVIAGKIPIGVVFDTERRLAVALEQKQLAWSTEYFDIPDLVNRNLNEAKEDFAGKTNTASVWKYCKDNGKSCPAIEYVSSYKTQGTNAGDWYLPATGELNKLYLNRAAVNVTLAKISGTSLCTDGCPSPWYWASSEEDNVFAWSQIFNGNLIFSYYKGGTDRAARPVLAF